MDTAIEQIGLGWLLAYGAAVWLAAVAVLLVLLAGSKSGQRRRR